MFKDAGKKIKMIAPIVVVVECIVSVIAGGEVATSNVSDDNLIAIGLMILVGGFLVAYLSGLMIYGFGEIVDTAIINRKHQAAPMPV